MVLFDFENTDAYLDLIHESGIKKSVIKDLAAKVKKGCFEDDYKEFLLCILDKVSINVKPISRGREEGDKNNAGCHEFEIIEEADNDPMFKAFMKSLRSHKTAYIANYKGHGLSFDITYEPQEGLDEERDHRKKSSRPSSTKAKSGKLNLDKDVDEPAYVAFLDGSKMVEDQPVYDDEHDNMIEGEDDEWAPFVEILDRATFYKQVNSNSSAEKSGFRRQLIAVLRKPYDEKEYARLFNDIEFRPLEMHHRELRHGRAKSVPTNKNKYGMSYLDRYPDLARKLARLHGDKPRCLNLLRGFFFWLEKSSNSESFWPWQDVECLGTIPESGEDEFFC